MRKKNGDTCLVSEWKHLSFAQNRAHGQIWAEFNIFLIHPIHPTGHENNFCMFPVFQMWRSISLSFCFSGPVHVSWSNFRQQMDKQNVSIICFYFGALRHMLVLARQTAPSYPWSMWILSTSNVQRVLRIPSDVDQRSFAFPFETLHSFLPVNLNLTLVSNIRAKYIWSLRTQNLFGIFGFQARSICNAKQESLKYGPVKKLKEQQIPVLYLQVRVIAVFIVLLLTAPRLYQNNDQL